MNPVHTPAAAEVVVAGYGPAGASAAIGFGRTAGAHAAARAAAPRVRP